MDEELEITGEQGEIKDKRILNLLPHQYKKGQSGNPSGRPKGISLKEYVKMKFASMNDDEREEFLNGIDKKILWEMAEDKPASKTDLTTNGKDLPTPILGNALPENHSIK